VRKAVRANVYRPGHIRRDTGLHPPGVEVVWTVVGQIDRPGAGGVIAGANDITVTIHTDKSMSSIDNGAAGIPTGREDGRQSTSRRASAAEATDSADGRVATAGAQVSTEQLYKGLGGPARAWVVSCVKRAEKGKWLRA